METSKCTSIENLIVGNYLIPIKYYDSLGVNEYYPPEVLKLGVKYEIVSVSYFDDLSVLVKLKTECGVE